MTHPRAVLFALSLPGEARGGLVLVGLFVFFFVFSLLFFFLAVSWQQEWRRRRIPMGVLSPFFYFFFIFFPNGAAPNTGGKRSARGRLRALLGIISSGFLYSLPKLQNNPRHQLWLARIQQHGPKLRGLPSWRGGTAQAWSPEEMMARR